MTRVERRKRSDHGITVLCYIAQLLASEPWKVFKIMYGIDIRYAH